MGQPKQLLLRKQLSRDRTRTTVSTVTGLSTGSHETWPIVIGMLRTLRPRLKRIAVFHSPRMPVEIQMRTHREVAEAAGIEWSHVSVSTPADVEQGLKELDGVVAQALA